MTYPNALIFVDFPSDDPEASAVFYHEVFGWEVEPRPTPTASSPAACPKTAAP